jgi:hypothetical protein
VEGSDRRRFYAVLHLSGIPSPLDAGAGGYRGGAQGKAMTDAEKLQRDIEGKLESIRLDWAEVANTLSPSERAEIRRSIELHLADLKDLISN